MDVQSPGVGETELKIQVDRRRLEAMITGEAPGEDAAAFFARVERITGTRVCWPSRLKIRAKTKKDPFVKLIGTPKNAQKASEMIEEHLRVKRERVTLKIEISHSLHSQVSHCIALSIRQWQAEKADNESHFYAKTNNANKDQSKFEVGWRGGGHFWMVGRNAKENLNGFPLSASIWSAVACSSISWPMCFHRRSFFVKNSSFADHWSGGKEHTADYAGYQLSSKQLQHIVVSRR